MIDEKWFERSKDQCCVSDAGSLPRHACAAQIWTDDCVGEEVVVAAGDVNAVAVEEYVELEF